jgi:hypothetical protein
MEPVTLIIDSANSKLSIRTRATGMLARLAHDIELAAADIRGQAVRNDEGFSGELVVPVSGLRVVGQLHGDRLDPAGISNSDRLEIERKIREEVFLGTKEIHLRGRGTAWNRADVTVETTRGKMSVPISIRGSEADGRVRISGRTELSLAALGVREIKGPVGAFKVKDAVEVLFEIILRPAG